MVISIDTGSRAFKYTFVVTSFLLSITLFAIAAYSWTGPTGSPPNNNVAAPVNVGATAQIKSGPLQVNGFRNTGLSQFDNNIGVGGVADSTWRVRAVGGDYGIYGTATIGQGIRGYADSGYAGYFSTGAAGGGLYAANGQGVGTYLAYPNNATWGVYTNKSIYAAGQVRADGGFCVGGNCTTSLGGGMGTCRLEYRFATQGRWSAWAGVNLNGTNNTGGYSMGYSTVNYATSLCGNSPAGSCGMQMRITGC